MTVSKPYLLVGASVGVICAGIVVGKLLSSESVRSKLFGFSDKARRRAHQDWKVDLSSEDSFPASDPPGYSPASAM